MLGAYQSPSNVEKRQPRQRREAGDTALTIPEWTTACQDWEQRIEQGQTLIPCPPLFPEEAASGVEVMSQLKIVDAPGSPTIGEACAPWVMDFAGAIFGSYDTDTGKREIKEYFLCVPKKNSKSTIAAGIMLTLLIRNWRQSAELIILAPTIEVAQNAYKPARDMVKHDEDLDALFNVQDHTRTITHRGTGATLKVVAADSNTVGGKKASFILVDEIHLFGKVGQAENMLREATGGLASRPEGCIIYLTTQSDQPPAGVFLQKLQYARGVRDGKIDDKSFMPVLYEFPRKMIDKLEHLKPENFKMTNPNLGYSVSQDYLERELMKAQEAGEESLRGFLSKFLNVEIGLALLSNRWTGAEFWERQARDKVTLDYILAHSEVITVGIDGGGLDDLLGMAVVGRCSTTRSWLVWCRAWAHPSVLERRKSEAARLHDFSKQGDLSLVQNIGQDVLEIAEIVKNIDDTGLLDRVGVDPAGIGAILDAIVESGVDQEKVVGVSQGWRLGGAIKTTERKLAEGGIIHANQPIMNWCCGNARVEPRGNSILITKQASGTAKIDPLIALFCAISLMATNPAATQKKYQMFVL